jgi:YhcN/YlaJ family sporulation lipoprotein
MNNVAVVGIDVDGTLTRSRVGNIKYSVAEAIRKDPRGVKALVTADMDISSRLAEMGRHISKGHPVSGFASEMADIIGRIIPQLPGDTKPRGNR